MIYKHPALNLATYKAIRSVQENAQQPLSLQQRYYTTCGVVANSGILAAIRVGYSSKTASRIEIELLNKTHVSVLRARQNR